VAGALRGALASGLVAACGVLLARLGAVSWQVVGVVVGVVMGAAILAPVVRTLVRRNDFDTAQIIDRRAGTSDLFSSAVAFSRGTRRDRMVEAVLGQAGEASRNVSAARLRPMESPVKAATLLAAGALLTIAWFFPAPARSPAPMEPEQSRAAEPLALDEAHEDLREEGRELVERLKEEKEGAEERELAEKLNDMWAALDAGEADREEIVENIARMANENVLTSGEKLQEMLDYLERLAEAMKRAPEIEEQAKELAQGNARPMADQMGRLGEKAGGGELSEDQQRRLGKAMKEGSEVPSQMSQALAQALAEAARSLEAGNMPQSGSALDEAAQALGNLERQLSALQRMSDVMKHLTALKRAAMTVTPRAGRPSESRFTMLSPSSLGNPTPGRQMGDMQGSAGDAAQSSAGDPESGSDGVGTSPGSDGLAQQTAPPAPSEDSSVTGELSGEGDIATIIYDSARFAGRAGTAYRQAHASAVDLLEASLSRERIPPERSAMVREYFELIAPTRGARTD